MAWCRVSWGASLKIDMPWILWTSMHSFMTITLFEVIRLKFAALGVSLDFSVYSVECIPFLKSTSSFFYTLRTAEVATTGSSALSSCINKIILTCSAISSLKCISSDNHCQASLTLSYSYSIFWRILLISTLSNSNNLSLLLSSRPCLIENSSARSSG